MSYPQGRTLHNNNQYTVPRAPVPPTRQPRPTMQMQQTQGSQNYPYSGQPMGQPLTTMFLPPQAVSMQGAHRVITIPGTAGQMPVNQMQYPQQYTINTSQPTQFQVTPNAYYQPQPMQAMQPSGAVYFQGQTATGQAQMQQTRPTLNQMPNQTYVTTAPQPQSYQKRERKAIAIVNPETMQEVSVGKQETSSGGNSGGSSARGTPVTAGATPPPPQMIQAAGNAAMMPPHGQHLQPGVVMNAPPGHQFPSMVPHGQGAVSPPHHPSAASDVQAQFAAQVAATLKKDKQPIEIKAPPPAQEGPVQMQHVQHIPVPQKAQPNVQAAPPINSVPTTQTKTVTQNAVPRQAAPGSYMAHQAPPVPHEQPAPAQPGHEQLPPQVPAGVYELTHPPPVADTCQQVPVHPVVITNEQPPTRPGGIGYEEKPSQPPPVAFEQSLPQAAPGGYNQPQQQAVATPCETVPLQQAQGGFGPPPTQPQATLGVYGGTPVLPPQPAAPQPESAPVPVEKSVRPLGQTKESSPQLPDTIKDVPLLDRAAQLVEEKKEVTPDIVQSVQSQEQSKHIIPQKVEMPVQKEPSIPKEKVAVVETVSSVEKATEDAAVSQVDKKDAISSVTPCETSESKQQSSVQASVPQPPNKDLPTTVIKPSETNKPEVVTKSDTAITDSVLRRPVLGGSKELKAQLESLPAELLAGPTSGEDAFEEAVEESEAVVSELKPKKESEDTKEEVQRDEVKVEKRLEDEQPSESVREGTAKERTASPFDDRKKKPPRQRLKEDDKKAGETDTPERERPNISTQPIDFTPGFIKEPPVPHRSVAVTNDVDARPASDDDVARRNELNDAKSSATTTTTAQDEEETEQTVISQPALKPQLQYDYKEDQWSPLNPEGKKAYDRQFLLTLQYAPDSVLKPFGLPNLPEVVLDSIGNRDSLPNSRGGHFSLTPDFTPGYVRQTSSQKGTPAKRGSQTRGSREPRKVISIQREQVDLHRTENAYKAFSKTEKASDDDEIVVRQFRSILNKLTPQKFKILIEQILVLPINTEVRLKRCIDTIFEKAIDEPNFSVAYANACAILSKHFVVETKPNERVSFKKLLLNRCQDEFQKDKSDTSEIEAMQKEIDEATTEEQKKVLQENREYAIMKNKRRSLGNIRFIGELFKLQMLTEKIMHDCVFKLVKSVDEESLECLCRLLSTVGKILDVEKSKMRMDQYFQRIEKIIAGKQTSSRVRFMLRDVVDLRSNKWVPRRDENNPKTIEQIHREAQDEKVEKQVMAQRYAQEMGSRRGKDRMDRGPGRNVDGEGWTSIPAKPNTLDPNKMKLSKPQVVDDNIQLGPGGPQFGGWGRGSTGGGKNTSQEAERPQSNVNRFSALTMSEAGYDQKRGASGGPMGRNRMGPPPGISGRRSDSRDKRLTPAGRGAMGSRPSKERDRGEREAAMAAVRQLSSGSGTSGRVTPSGSRNQSRESSRNRGHVDKPGTSTVPQELTPEQVERKTKATIDEYLQIHDLKEAKECVKEIPAKSMPRFVDIAINHVLERNTQARQRTGTLLHDLVTSHVLSVEQYLEGLKVVLEFAEDMEIDIPKIWQYFGELIGPMVQDGSVPLSFLKSACQPIQHTGKAGKLVAEVLHDAVHRLGHIKVGELWRASLLQWSDFLVEKQDLRQFIKDQKLEFTVGDEVPRSPVGKNLTAKQVSKELDFLLSERNADNEVVFDWVESNVGEVNLKKHYFIRALMASICRSVIQGNSTDGERLKKRCFIMQRYLDHNAELELQALYGLQALVNELQHPPGVLRSIFDILYDEDIISEDAFNQWEKSTDPAESAGKGVALTSVNQFFTWLRETEEEEEQ